MMAEWEKVIFEMRNQAPPSLSVPAVCQERTTRQPKDCETGQFVKKKSPWPIWCCYHICVNEKQLDGCGKDQEGWGKDQEGWGKDQEGCGKDQEG